jgi:hypothetical protein
MRFYKPRLREYVSTQVDMPWEFLQGVAEQKQKSYDAALAQGDAANKLLNFEVNPGDMPGKQHVQNEYNDQLYQITDYIRQTGDFNTASREFAKVIKNIAQDKRIQVMTNAVKPYSEQKPVIEKMITENKLLNPWQSNWNPMYSTYNPETGELRNYNQSVGYETPDYNKYLKETFGDLRLSTSGNSYEVVDPINGTIQNISTEGGAITAKDIMNRAKTSLYNYRATPAYFDHKQEALYRFRNGLVSEEKLKEFETDPNKAVSELSDEIAVNKLYVHGLQQIESKFSRKVDTDYMPEWKYNQLNPPDAPDTDWIPLEAMNIAGTVTDNEFENQEGSLKQPKADSKYGWMRKDMGVPETRKDYYKPFKELSKENKQIALKWFETTNNPKLKRLYENNQLDQKTLGWVNGEINKYRNQFFATAKQNVQGRGFKDPGKVAKQYVGVESSNGTFDAENLTSGAGFLTSSTEVYNVKTNEKMPLNKIPIAPGDKAEISKEFSWKSPFFTLSGNNPLWSVPRQLVIKDKDGAIKGIYAIPRIKEDREFTAAAINSSALYTPGVKAQSHRSAYNIQFNPVNPSTLQPLTQDEIQSYLQTGKEMKGSYDIYDKSGNLVNDVILPTPEDATYFLNEIE